MYGVYWKLTKTQAKGYSAAFVTPGLTTTRERCPTPDVATEFVAAQKEYYLHTIECFGPDRCMFESNFPVDKLSLSYPVLWNGLKKIVADFSDTEKHAMFFETASRVYRLD